MIPKRIICTHVSQHTLEPKLKYCINLMRRMHPKWEFLFFSDGDCRDFIRKEMPDYLELYDWYPRPVQKADLFRLLAVYRMGGFYLDTDFMLEASLDPLCRENAVFAFEHKIGNKAFHIRYPEWLRTREEKLTLANYAFGAMAGHPFLLALLDELVVRTETFESEDCNDLDVLHSTGPDAVTSVYYRQREQWTDVKMLKSDKMGFGKYGVHLVHGVWRQDGYKDG
jgi:mannosyltransferase OCH1-like enzyme